MTRLSFLAGIAGAALFATGASAQYVPGSEIAGQTVQVETNGVINNVTFEPGCRNFWHIHHAEHGGGQVLICVDGEGWYQEEGKAPQSLKPGDIVEIPAGVKHWHGAAPATAMTHIALTGENNGSLASWMEKVSGEQYGGK